MINIPDAVKTALTATSRSIKVKVRLEIDGVMTEVVEAMTADIDCTTSGTSTDELPFGIVTCNEIKILFDNLSHKFTLDNTASPFYGKLQSGTKVLVNFLILQADTTWYVLPDMVWYADSWKFNNDSSTATLSCLDELANYKDKEIPAFPIQKNIMVKDAFKLLFTQLGVPVNIYNIDSDLTDVIQYFWKQGNTFQAQLESLAQATLTNVFTTTDGIIHVRSAIKKQDSVYTLTDQNFIMSTEVQPSYYNTYSACEITYKALKSVDQAVVYSAQSIIVQPGVTHLSNVAFSQKPILNLIATTINGGADVSILDLTFTSETFNITISNGSATSQTIDLQVIGTILNSTDLTVKANSTVAVPVENKLSLKVDYIISLELVSVYAKKIINNFNGTYTTMKVNVRGFPILELFDKIRISSASGKIDKEFRIIAIEQSYDTGLDGTLTVSVPADTVASKFLFICPGLIIGI